MAQYPLWSQPEPGTHTQCQQLINGCKNTVDEVASLNNEIAGTLTQICQIGRCSLNSDVAVDVCLSSPNTLRCHKTCLPPLSTQVS